jgi:Right handed beta helix region
MKRILLILAIFMFPTNSFPATYYVSNAGEGSTCSIGSPCAISYAFTNAVAGDTWLFRGGTYNIPAHTSADSYVGTYNFANSGTGDAEANRIIFKAYTGEIPILNGTLTGSGESPPHCFHTMIGTNGKDYITIDGFTFQSDGGVTTPRVIIGGQAGYSDYVTIKNCTFNGGSTTCTDNDNNEGIRLEYSTYALISRNTMYSFLNDDLDLAMTAFKAYNGYYTTIEYNYIYDSNGAIYFKSYGDYNTIRYNFFYHCGTGIEASTNSHFQTNGSIYHNIIVLGNTNDVGLQLYSSDDAIDNWTIYNNTIYSSTASPAVGALAFVSNVSGTGFQVYNNVFDTPSGSDYGVSVRYTGIVATIIDYNNYSAGIDGLCGGTAWANLTDLKAATCASLTSPNHDQNSIAGDPIFVNGSGNLNLVSDFALTTESPGYHAGNDGKDMGADVTLVGLTGGSGSTTSHQGVTAVGATIR